MTVLEMTIAELGGRGDGIANHNGEKVFVPFTVPGDRVRVTIEKATSDGLRARVIERLADGPDRAAPPCRHFGTCGGCALQHLTPEALATWKLDRLSHDLARMGGPRREPISLGTIALHTSPAGSRRRAEFTLMAKRGHLIVGFTRRGSHQIVDLEQCPVLRPELAALPELIRHHLVGLLPVNTTLECFATLLDGGIDLLLTGPLDLTLDRRERLATFAETLDLARLSWRARATQPPEPIAYRRPLRFHFGSILVAPPPGGFLQATAEGEAALIATVVEWLAGVSGPVLDLYAGCGTFTFPMAERFSVHAVEGDGTAVTALKAAARSVVGVSAERRDLEREPLNQTELNRFGAVIFNPPRAGAGIQSLAISASAVPVVVAVSCNPATFVRDAQTLIGGDYRLEKVVAVDQFLWSPHLELVALFRKGNKFNPK
ncbi:Uncharacterized RNA methyltransferase BR0438/BS1330_I0439 [uncultured Gammaproteobacteria bacterium]